MSSEEKIKLLKRKRTSLRTSVSNSLIKLDNELLKSEDIDVNNLEELVETLTNKFDSLSCVDNELEPYFKDDEFQVEFEKSEEYKEKVVIAKFRAKKKINQMKLSTVSNEVESSNLQPRLSRTEINAAAAEKVRIQLPKLSIAKFFGDVSQWLTFWNSFETAIHNNESLEKVDKFNYLKAHLGGSALHTVEGLSISNANYESAIELLKNRYRVCLPWLESHLPLSDHKELAEKRLSNTVKSHNSSNMLKAYQDVFDEWKKEGIIEQINPDQKGIIFADSAEYFLPNKPVIKENSTTKIRPVFENGSAKTRNSSLNECIEKGPNMIELIPSVLNRFRWGKIGVIADIRKAFLQISLHENDREFLKFLWWRDGDPHKLGTYRHCRVVFGVSCSPFLLAAVLNHHLENVPEDLKDLTKKLKDSLYVDIPSSLDRNRPSRERMKWNKSGGFPKFYSQSWKSQAQAADADTIKAWCEELSDDSDFCIEDGKTNVDSNASDDTKDGPKSVATEATNNECKRNEKWSTHEMEGNETNNSKTLSKCRTEAAVASATGKELNQAMEDNLKLDDKKVATFTSYLEGTETVSLKPSKIKTGETSNSGAKGPLIQRHSLPTDITVHIGRTGKGGESARYNVGQTIGVTEHYGKDENQSDMRNKYSTFKSDGPSWLKGSRDSWPNYKLIPDEKVVNAEMKKTVVSSLHGVKDEYYNRISSYKRIIRVTGWIFRFFRNAMTPGDKKSGPLCAEDLRKAELIIIKKVQNEECFSDNFQGKGNVHVPKVGDVVLVWSDNIKRVNWPMARSLEIDPSKDGLVRLAKIKTKSGVFIRPVQKLCHMELDSDGVNVNNTTTRDCVSSNHAGENPAEDVRKTDPVTTRSGRVVRVPHRFGL